jgi:hypothetical protein
MRWLRRWHRCELPILPLSFEDAFPKGFFNTGETSFICPECGKQWKLVWVSDIVEPTIMQPVDIGGWRWQMIT